LRKELARNGELGGVGFLVKVMKTTKGFSKSFSRGENSKKSLTSAKNYTAFHYFNQANLNIACTLIYTKKERTKLIGEALQT